MVAKEITVSIHVIIIIPIIGASVDVTFENTFGKYPTSADAFHPNKEPIQANAINPSTALPTQGAKHLAKTNPKGAFEFAISNAGIIPAITFVDAIYTTAAPNVPPNTAIGTFFSGFSTASVLAHADSKPKNDHKVNVIELVTASPNGRLLTLHWLTYNYGLNHIQPNIEIDTTGIITPHTVTDPIRPVIFGPPKFATLVIHNNPIVAKPVIKPFKLTSKNTAP